MPIIGQGGIVTLRANVGHSNGNPADDPGLTLTILDTPGDPVAGFPVAIPPIVRDDLGAYHYIWTVPVDLPTGDYTATWDATVDGADAGGSEQVEVVEPGTITVPLVSIVEFEVFRDYLGVAADATECDDVSRLLDAIAAEARRLTRRDFEGDEGGDYNEVYRIRGEEEFMLPHVPVASISSINRVYFDGTEDAAYEATEWRLEDAARGVIRLGFTAEYIRVVYRTTGEIEAQVPQAMLEWGKARWNRRDRDPILASYRTGEDAESYFEALAGRPPGDVLRALLGVRHATGGGVV
jgi:hypothetical protein